VHQEQDGRDTLIGNRVENGAIPQAGNRFAHNGGEPLDTDGPSQSERKVCQAIDVGPPPWRDAFATPPHDGRAAHLKKPRRPCNAQTERCDDRRQRTLGPSAVRTPMRRADGI